MPSPGGNQAAPPHGRVPAAITELHGEITAPGSAGASSRLVNGVVALGALGVAGLAFYETPERYDRLPRGRVDAISRPVARLENAGRLMQGDRGTR